MNVRSLRLEHGGVNGGVVIAMARGVMPAPALGTIQEGAVYPRAAAGAWSGYGVSSAPEELAAEDRFLVPTEGITIWSAHLPNRKRKLCTM